MKRLAVVALVSLWGCALDGSVGRADTTAGSGTGSGGEGSGGSTTAGPGSDSGAMSAGGSGDSAGGTSASDGGSTGGDPHDVCEPQVTDAACSECRKHNCCAQLTACHDYDPCPCMWECMLMTDGDEVGCTDHCAYEGHTFADLVDCTIGHCDVECSDPHPPGPMD